MNECVSIRLIGCQYRNIHVSASINQVCCLKVYMHIVVEFGEVIKNPAYRIPQTEYSGCLDISAHA